MTTPSIRQFSVAAATSRGRVIVTSSGKVKGEGHNARYFKQLTNFRTHKNFRNSLKRRYGDKVAQGAIDEYGLVRDRFEALSGEKIKEVLSFCEAKRRPGNLDGIREDRMIEDRENMSEAARSALLFFKGSKDGKKGGSRPDGHKLVSTNNPFGRATGRKKKYRIRLAKVRPKDGRARTGLEKSELAMRYGVGNCGEKSQMVAVWLRGNPRLNGKYVTTMHSLDYDHAFTVVTDEEIKGPINSLKELGENAMLVDGWTEDFYFPNQSSHMGKKRGNGTPNPRQSHVRRQIRNHKLEPTRQAMDKTDSSIEELPQPVQDFLQRYPLRGPLKVERHLSHNGVTERFAVYGENMKMHVELDDKLKDSDKSRLAEHVGQDRDLTEHQKVTMRFISDRRDWEISYLEGRCRSAGPLAPEEPFLLGLEEDNKNVTAHADNHGQLSYSQPARFNDLPPVTQAFFGKYPLEGPMSVERYVKEDGSTDYFKLTSDNCVARIQANMELKPHHRNQVKSQLKRLKYRKGQKWHASTNLVRMDFKTPHRRWAIETIGGTIEPKGDDAASRSPVPLRIGLHPLSMSVKAHKRYLKESAKLQKNNDDTADL